MAKKTVDQRPIEAILSNSADNAKLQQFLDEAAKCKLRIADENSAIKDIRDEAVDKLGIAPKMFNNLLRIVYDNNAAEKKVELENLDFAICSLFGIEDSE
jgi:hypothetical protein